MPQLRQCPVSSRRRSSSFRILSKVNSTSVTVADALVVMQCMHKGRSMMSPVTNDSLSCPLAIPARGDSAFLAPGLGDYSFRLLAVTPRAESHKSCRALLRVTGSHTPRHDPPAVEVEQVKQTSAMASPLGAVGVKYAIFSVCEQRGIYVFS